MSTIKLQSEYEELDKYKNINDDIWYCKKDTNILHNPYGPSIIYEDGMKIYHIENKRHRLDGPAVIWSSGYEEYYIEGKRHRLDGPAIIDSHGYREYYINGYSLTKEEFEMNPERLKYLGKEYLICLK